MNESREILNQDITGCTTNGRGQVTKVWFRTVDQFYLDAKTKTLKSTYNTTEYVVSTNAVKVAIRRAKEWKNACSSE